uniref:Cation efflux protein transmembrane domain-containing protein n=1 Tax=Alexandrium monilatum TaxID=311494 RepID=A0A7S4Q4R1_9DINO|mmetsp:Transcript_71270/g.212581  ORF Transcript_71270/g.212581 Transcript_71270/m.212581 type:complete len:375 (+) Transcript_71270:51-1175(+)
MPAASEESNGGAARLERSAVSLSLWVGGIGLACIKGMVYIATGSVLVRASMFDSLGDVFSSLIMALTQWKANDHRDMHRYPMGKGRFAPLGVMFFCAFMCSTMIAMSLDSLQGLFSEDSQDSSATLALQRLFAEQTKLRWAHVPFWSGRLGTKRVEELIAQYGSGEEGGSVDTLATVLLGSCVAVKLALFVWCRFVGRRKSSEIVAALAADHRNDTITNTLVITTMVGLEACQGSSWDGPWLAKVDPAVSLLMSIWIVYGWITNALEQFRILSDQRVEDADVEAINKAAVTALQGSSLTLQGTEVYHVGDSYRVQLTLHPGSANGATQQMATLFDNVEGAVRGCISDVQQVDVHLRSRSSSSNEAFGWVKEYSK